jgi:HEAT repeat protein
MSRRKKWIAAILAVSVIAGCVMLVSRPREPRHEGRSLSYWARRSHQPEAQRALTAMGTNALPFLIEWLDEEPTQFDAWLRRAGQRLPNSLQPDPWPFGSRRDNAAHALGLLGTNAIPAIPELIRTFDWNWTGGLPPPGLYALANIGPAAIPALLQALEEDAKRYHAVVSTIVYMGWRKPRSPQDLRAIVAALDQIAGHPAKAVRLSVASQLMLLVREEIHEEVCLVWEKLLRDEFSDVRTTAVESAVRLIHILPGSSKLDLLMPLRDDPHPSVRRAVEDILQKAGRLGPLSETADTTENP